MLRAFVCLLILFAVSPVFAAGNIECTIISEERPALTEGLNKQVLCGDMIHALKAEFEENVSGTLEATMTAIDTYTVDFDLNATLNGDNYTGSGQEDWNPAGSEFIIDTFSRAQN